MRKFTKFQGLLLAVLVCSFLLISIKTALAADIIIIFNESVDAGPVASDTINVDVSGIYPPFDNNYYGFTSGLCNDTVSFLYAFDSGVNFTLNDYTYNGQYLCLKVIDNSSNIAYKKSTNVLNLIPPNPPTIASATASPNPAKAGTVTVTLVFSENMNTAVNPTVSITGITGTPSVTKTSYSGNTWVGTFTLADNNEDVWASIAVSGAKSAFGVNMNATPGDGEIHVDTISPVVNAGVDKNVNAQVSQNATVTGATTYSWTKQSGPGTVTFGSAAAEDTTISANADGVYVLRLTATDAAGNSAYDEITFTWDTTAPTVEVGTNMTTRAIVLKDVVTSGATSWLWTKQSGPGVITFGSATAEDTNVTASLDGDYVLRLTVTDAAGNSAYDEYTLTWDTTYNGTVNAGVDKNVNAQVLQNATVTGSVLFAWTQISGPGFVSFGSQAAEDTTISADTNGSYVLRLTSWDSIGNSAYDEINFVWDTVAPIVSAGSDNAGRFPTNQDATVTGATIYAWTKTSGPGTVTFGTPSAEDTTISTNADGNYVLRLTATDAAGNSAYDEMNFAWDNTAPVVSVGADVTTNSLFSKNASATDSLTGVAQYTWSKTSGPGTITFGSPSAEDTTISASLNGTYVIRLTAMNSILLTNYDEFTLVWDTRDPEATAVYSPATATNGNVTVTITPDEPATITNNGGSNVYTFTSNGNFTFNLLDAAGNPGTMTATVDYIDKTAPTASVSYNITGTTNQDVIATITPSESVTVTNNGGLTTHTFTANGSFTFNFTDAVGNTGSAIATIANIDKTPPADPTFSPSTSSPTNGNVTVTVTYAGDSVANLYSLDNVIWYLYTVPIVFSSNGTLYARAQDAPGNTSNVTSYVVSNIDKTAPAAAVINTVSSDDVINASERTATVTVTGTNESGSSVTLNGNAVTANTATTWSYVLSAAAINAFGQGAETLTAVSTDGAGNTSSGTKNINIDTVVPTVDAGTDKEVNSAATQNATVSGATSYSWSKVSGTGTITFGTPSAEDTTISSNTDGAFVLRLTVSDAAGNSVSDDINFTWDTISPSVNAGSDAVTGVQISQNATVSGATSYSWTKISGAGTITFGSPSAIDTTISANTDDVYVLRLTATDTAGNSAYDEISFTWTTTVPTVEVGLDVTANSQITKNVTTANATNYAWTKVSGPGAITFGTPSSEDTTISADTDGVYVIRLTVTDALLNSAEDTFTLTWDTAAPVVDAGLDVLTNVTVFKITSVTGATTFAWTKTSGTGVITFGTPSANDTTITSDTNGTFVLRITATDAVGNSAYDEINFTWDTVAPAVNAGSDVVTDSQISQDATVTGATTYEWTKISGAGTITFGAPSAIDTTISADTDDVYVLRLTATDAAGNSAYDEISFTWDTADIIIPVITLTGVTPVTVELGSAYVDAGATALDDVDGNITGSIVTVNPVNVNLVGSYTVTYNVSDAALNAATQVTRTVNVVDTTDPVITLTGANPQTIAVGSSYVELGASVSDNQAAAISPVINSTAVNTNVLGSYSVTYNATDTAGNAATQVTRTVNVTDTAKPVITLLGTTPVTVELGSSYTDAGATALDNFDGSITGNIVTVNPVNINTIGSYTVTYNVSDSSGNAATQVTRTVNVSADVTNPVLTLLGTTPITVELGSSYTDAGATALDNVDGNITGSIVTVNPVNINLAGSYTVTYNVSDSSGNDATQLTRAVNVTDATDPIITLTGSNPQTIELGSSYVELGASVSDNQTAPISPVINTAAVNTNIVGSYTVTYNATDTAGNAATQITRTVNVVDTTDPVITLTGANPQSIQVGGTYTELGASVSDNQTALISPVINATAVNTNSVGSYSVTYNATDAAGNTATQVTRTVNITPDTTIPVITLTGTTPVTVELGSSYTDAGATALDNIDGNITASIVTVNPVNVNLVGSYTVTYNVSDTATNAAVQVTRTVNVVDTTDPVITLTGANPQSIQVGGTYTELGASVSDNQTALISPVINSSAVNTNSVGSYSVTYNATDTAGNAATQVTRTVNITSDVVIPVITLLGATPVTVELGSSYTDAGATALDNIDGNITASIVTVNPVNVNLVGSYTVTYNVSDLSGNAATQVTRTVNVVDTNNPSVVITDDEPGVANVVNGDVIFTFTFSEPVNGFTVSDVVVTGGTKAASFTLGADGSTIYTLAVTPNADSVSNITVNVPADVAQDVSLNNNTAALQAVQGVDTVLATITPLPDVIVNAETVLTSTSTDAVSWLWEQISGPGTITFGAPTASTTTAVASVDGTYVVRLTVTDASGNVTYEEMNLTMNTVAPSVEVGADIATNILITKDASSTNAVSYLWSKESGTGNITFGSATLEDTTISADTDDTYVIKLTVTDAASNVASDTFTLTWDTVEPIVIDLNDTVTNGTSTLTDTTMGAVSWLWEQISGPGTITFGAPTASSTTITADIDGTYVIRLTVTDAAGNSSSDEINFVRDTVGPIVELTDIININNPSIISATTTNAVSYLWTQVSGPGTIIFGTPTASSTTVTADIDGSYIVKLAVYDTAGNLTEDTLTLIWDTTAPTISAGPALGSIVLPTTLQATSTDSTYLWSKISGPGTVTFSPSATILNPSVSANVAGDYAVLLTASDDAGNTATSSTTFTWTVAASGGGGGGGGGGGAPASTPCSTVVYGAWSGTCSNQIEYRNITSQSPISCQITTEQEAARSRACNITVVAPDTTTSTPTPTTDNDAISFQSFNEQASAIMDKARADFTYNNRGLTNRLSGRIILQVEERGEAWYVNPDDRKKYYLGRPQSAFAVMRLLGLGISNNNLRKVPVGLLESSFNDVDTDRDGLTDRLEKGIGTDWRKSDTDNDKFSDLVEVENDYNPFQAGKTFTDKDFTGEVAGQIFLQVETNGEAWYIDPVTERRFYLGRPDEAMAIARKLGLGITNKNLSQIPVGRFTPEQIKKIADLLK